ncbi:MAG: hypothetical protein IIC32_03090 [Chloroflexi bacterium]|nr:hypothetical protein [Chloroflexota bacterium]
MRRAAVVAAIAWALALGVPGAAIAQDAAEAVITGVVAHGADPGSFDPTALLVSLDVLEGVSPLAQLSTRPAADGTFTFTVAPAPTRTYFLSVEHQGARYSASRRADTLDDPVTLTVFDATNDPGVLRFDTYTVLVTGALGDDGIVEVLERVAVSNDSDTTLVPDFDAEGPAMLGFLRFGLPSGAYNLDVRSDLVGGEVLEVDLGFALTTPVPPTRGEPHEFEFVYRLDYDGSAIDLSRTMRFGAASFRFVAPVDVARPASPRLVDLGAAEFDGRLLRLLEGEDIAPGERIELTLSGLPTPSLRARLQRQVGDVYLRFVVPGLVASAMLGLLVVGLARRRRASAAEGASAAERRAALLAEVGALEARRRDGSVSDRSHEAERAALKQALVALEIEERLDR